MVLNGSVTFWFDQMQTPPKRGRANRVSAYLCPSTGCSPATAAPQCCVPLLRVVVAHPSDMAKRSCRDYEATLEQQMKYFRPVKGEARACAAALALPGSGTLESSKAVSSGQAVPVWFGLA